jgi:hypothetical protein
VVHAITNLAVLERRHPVDVLDDILPTAARRNRRRRD